MPPEGKKRGYFRESGGTLFADASGGDASGGDSGSLIKTEYKPDIYNKLA